MPIRENKFPIHDLIVPQHVLVSVFDKTGLPGFVRELRVLSSGVMFYSTGGTGEVVREALGDDAKSNYISIEQFTGSPEMEGGLVKTLHPSVHGGLLGERGNPEHEKYFAKDLPGINALPGVYFDIMVGGPYPFGEVVCDPEVTPETARVNIDIGGPTMIMAAAKNWHSVAVLTRHNEYGPLLEHIVRNKGITAAKRFRLAQTAMNVIARYRENQADYFDSLDYKRDVLSGLKFVEAA